ncbi:hypothetical protein D9M68_313530 [compost metagenome]
MRESRSLGSVRGALGNGRPYRESEQRPAPWQSGFARKSLWRLIMLTTADKAEVPAAIRVDLGAIFVSLV